MTSIIGVSSPDSSQPSLSLPRRPRGRPSAATNTRYGKDLRAFCDRILEIHSSLEFTVSARGWCYLLEEYGLRKGDFDTAHKLIGDCRKVGLLPIDIVAEDSAREFGNLEQIDDDTTPEQEAADLVAGIRYAHLHFHPFSFWDNKDVYVQMLVEKVDLKSLFGPICREFRIPLANARGWSDIRSRAAMMRRYKDAEQAGKRCALLYCGDFDPAGLNISNCLRDNLAELSHAVGWSPDNLVVDRFGLNEDFIRINNLTWIDNLETGSGKDLADPKHPDHSKPYVQDYIRRYGVRKVEANALVVRADAGRELCLDATRKYLDEDAPEEYEAEIRAEQQKVQHEIAHLMAGVE